MKINWEVRLKNKIWLSSAISLIVATVYSVLDLCGVIPQFSQKTILDIFDKILTILGMFGLVQDPTTAGMSDSKRAMEYKEPWDDNNPQPVLTGEGE